MSDFFKRKKLLRTGNEFTQDIRIKMEDQSRIRIKMNWICSIHRSKFFFEIKHNYLWPDPESLTW